MPRDIRIQPNRSTTGSTQQPTIYFSGTTAASINLKVEDDGSIVFEGNNGGLFNITDSKDGLLSSVNDVSGLPIFAVYSSDKIIAGAYNQNTLVVDTDKVFIGSDTRTVPSGTKLIVSGNTLINGTLSASTLNLFTTPTLSSNTQFLTRNSTTGNIEYSNFSSISTGDTFVTGFTYSTNNLTISQNQGRSPLTVNISTMSGLTVNGSFSATTYLGLPIDPDNYVTGGTYTNGTLTLNRQNGSVTIPGFLTGTTDTYVTGFTFNNSTYDLTIYQNNGTSPLTQNLTALASDVNVTGGTYNPSNGVATFYNNAGGNFDVTGFLTGFTDIYLSTGTYNPNNGNLTLTRTDSVNVVITGFTDYYVTGGTYSSGTLTLNRQNGSVFVTGLTNTDTFVTGFTYSNNNLTINQNQGQLPLNVNISVMSGLTINGNLTVTGITSLKSYTATSGIISGSGQNILTVIGSGSSTTSPLFSIQGSSGELFSVTDSLTGSLFSVNDISGLPIVEVFSDNTILMGSYLAPSLNTTVKITANSGTTNIYSIPTSAYTGAFFEYTVNDGTNLRAGSIMSIWSGNTVNYTETSTTDIGNTTPIIFNMTSSSGFALLRTSATTNSWTVKTIVRSI